MCGPLVLEGRRISVPWRGDAWSRRTTLVAVLGLCLVLRGAGVLIVLVTNPHAVLQVDSASYLRPTSALVEHAQFLHGPGGHQPEFVRTPGYPAFIAVVYLIFGASHAALLLAQAVVSTLTVLVVWLLGARMWSFGIAAVAAVLTIAEPLQWFSAGTILSENLATLLLASVAGIGFVLFCQERPRLAWCGLLGLTIAVTTMVRPVTYYLPVVVIGFLIGAALRRRTGARHAVAMLVAFLIPLLVVVGGWQLRNHEQVGSWRFSGVEGKNLYLFRAAGIVAHERGLTLDAAQRALTKQLGTPAGQTQGAYYGRMYREGLQIVIGHPVDALAGTVAALFHEITSTRSRVFSYLGMSPASRALEYAATASLLLFYACCLGGFGRVVRAGRDPVAHLYVMAVVGYVLLASAGPEAAGGRGERFRSVVMPILALYAAKGAYEFVRRLQRHRATVDGDPSRSG